jgi:hypothetical protein
MPKTRLAAVEVPVFVTVGRAPAASDVAETLVIPTGVLAVGTKYIVKIYLPCEADRLAMPELPL